MRNLTMDILQMSKEKQKTTHTCKDSCVSLYGASLSCRLL